MSTPMSGQIRVSRWFDASPERVFDAWVTHDLVGKWMFADEEVVGIDLDARVGEMFSFRVRRQGEVIEHVGRYLEIERPVRLAFTWATDLGTPDPSRVSIDLVRLESGTDVTLIHQLQPDWAGQANQVEAAWTKMLDRLDNMLAELAE